MRREIHVERILNDDRPRRQRRDYYGRRQGNFRYDKGRGLHLLGGRRDGLGPHLDEGCNTEERNFTFQRGYSRPMYQTQNQSKIKMFTSKKDMVDFVNEIGEKGQQVDIFKIEEELYKVVYYLVEKDTQ